MKKGQVPNTINANSAASRVLLSLVNQNISAGLALSPYTKSMEQVGLRVKQVKTLRVSNKTAMSRKNTHNLVKGCANKSDSELKEAEAST